MHFACVYGCYSIFCSTSFRSCCSHVPEQERIWSIGELLIITLSVCRTSDDEFRCWYVYTLWSVPDNDHLSNRDHIICNILNMIVIVIRLAEYSWYIRVGSSPIRLIVIGPRCIWFTLENITTYKWKYTWRWPWNYMSAYEIKNPNWIRPTDKEQTDHWGTKSSGECFQRTSYSVSAV